ncbi:Het-C-domain-containing protein [Massarina eburnea CBS 473.64]|uniref:Het-C-domain-containing protein n=1 Tax=Massarina eburnea CBS 473.64 TaxID=1395130 RepID=A0A6A6RQ70_9PLEO|nr:Het-C-domain-containing protein [Massarina eburnea CBS 473.64]
MAPNLSALTTNLWLPCLILLVFWARPTAAFGAGNIASTSKVEGQRWRHGDIEDTLLTLLISSRGGKKFSKMDVKRVYFGNWLRDYSQAVDVGTVKSVSAEAIRILIWVLGFMSFGYGTKEFEVTSDRLGCYRPEEHIDNPKDYADNVDAQQYDRRLRAPVDEERELSVDERTGLKHYIASEDRGITTSAGMVRDLLHRCIDLGRQSGGRGPDFYEALRLLGTATHCMEDYSAHSNYTELALIEMGEKDVFPHVGRNTRSRVEGVADEVYPIVTGTFGGVDFLHSVCGEISDKTTQSELNELEGAINDADRKGNKSTIKDLLSQLPDGIFGGKDQAGKADELEQNAQAAQMQNMQISPKDPEEFTQQIDELVKQIYPVMEFHDEIMMSIEEFIENIPVLPDLIENIQSQISIFVFSLLAPFVLPILDQVKSELETGSSEVIASSREKQHVVFNDDNSTDPTHSMLSKDHFSNLLNRPAGNIASEVLKWVVPQVVACWDGEADPEQTINTIIEGVFHHPAKRQKGSEEANVCRNIMYSTVENWWNSVKNKEELRGMLNRKGVQESRNHTGEVDSGHGCCKPLGIANNFNATSGGSNQQFQGVTDHAGKLASEAVGGGALGGYVGGLVGGIGGSILGGVFGGDKKESKSSNQGNDGSYTQSYSESGHRQEQDASGGSYGYQQSAQTSNYGGSERREESRYESGNQYQSEERREDYGDKKHGKKHGSEDEQSGDEDDYEKRQRKEQKRREKEERKQKKYGSGNEDSGDDAYKRRSGEHKRRSQSPRRHGGESGGYGDDSYSTGGAQQGYGGDSYNSGGAQQGYGGDSYNSGGAQQGYGGDSYNSGGAQQGYGGDSYNSGGGHSGRQESSGYGGDSYNSGGGGGYGRQEQSGYGRQEGSGYGGDSYGGGGSGGYGREEQPSYGRQEEPYGGRRGDDEFGERRHHGGGGDDGYGRRY